MKDTIYMNDDFYEPIIELHGSITEIEELAEKQFNEINPKYDWDLNQKVENDYHNTYYNTKSKKYGIRSISMSNKDWHEMIRTQRVSE